MPFAPEDLDDVEPINFDEKQFLHLDAIPDVDDCPVHNLRIPCLPFAPDDSENPEPKPFDIALFEGNDAVPSSDSQPSLNDVKMPNLPSVPSEEYIDEPKGIQNQY